MYLKDIEKSVKEVITELLDSLDDRTGARHSPYDLDASFLELGINSVLAVELVEAMNQKLGIELGVEVMFDYKDVKELTHFIFQHYGKKDLSKEHMPLVDEVRFSAEGNIDADNKALMPAIEERDDKQVALGERRSSDVAIIGISGRFAGSANIEAFWQHLQAGESCIEEIKRKGWETSLYYDPDPERPNRSISKWGGMLQDIDHFDAFFFNISPREAARMDPQQRFFLQEAYRAFEDAGYSSEELSDKKVGVFVGARSGDYKELRRDSAELRRDSADPCRDSALRLSEEIDSHLFLGSDMAILAARISYFLNCKGPSLTIDTACSSSLVAIHLACESIRTGESEMALAGGVFLLTSPEFYVMTSKTQMLSPDGKCKTFDNTANGIVVGEGVGAVILKPLDAALEDGDHIYGIIKGSGVNQDGRTKGITAPSMLSQKALLSDVYKKAAVDPETVSYIEVHGTGTKLGDPIEIKALTEAFRIFTDKTQFCAIGSHKPNIGHTIMIAGLAGVFKVLLTMKYQQIPPTINIEQVNQHIDLEKSPFFINTELREWKSRDGHPRRAGVSSFGFSGTNCHIILEEPPLNKKTAPQPTRPAYFFPLSAKTKAALSQKVADLVKWLEKEGETYALADISYTLVHGRSHFPIRSAVVARDTRDLLHALRASMSKGEEEHEGINEEGRHSEQMEPLFQTFGNGLLNELSEDAIFELKEYKEKLAALADLYVKGYNLDWGKIFKKGRHHRIPLPTYPFTGESYWIAESNEQKRVALRPLANHPVLSRKGADQLQPSITLSSGLSFSQSRSNNDVEAVDKALARTSQSVPKGDDRPIFVEAQALPTTLTFSGTGRREAPDRGQPYPPLQEELARSLATVLYMEESAVDVEKPFVEMGLDSVLGVEWIQSLNKRYASSLKATCVYDYPTIRQLAGFLEKEVLKPASAERLQAKEAATSLGDRPPRRLDLERKEAIAIVGMSGKYPDACNLTEYWENLVQGKNAIREIPLSRWDCANYYDPSPAASGKISCKWLGALDEIEYFDPLFFHLSPAEAEAMDPQQRLFLEEGYKAFEDAGYSPELLSNRKCGVYLGMMSHEYDLLLYQHEASQTNILGTSSAIAAARIAYLLNLKGPAIAIDTACSSSLVATHLACQALSLQEIDLALVGGVSLYLTPSPYVGMCSAGMLSPDGQCKAFDASANGFVPGEGVGALVLKRLADAEADHDQIYGLIIGSGINQDGATNGIMAPSVKSQTELEREIYKKYQIDPASISYVEMHGTGTKLGDPIELEALATVFQEKTQHKQYCAIGSVKSNIGHTSAAAGAASVQKVLLAMKHKKLVPTLNFQQPNPHFDFAASPFYVNTAVRDWRSEEDTALRAAVSSFGFSGTNAHLVIEEYIDHRDADEAVGTGASPVPTAPARRPYGPCPQTPILFVLSAKSEQQLKNYAQEMKRWIQTHAELALEDIAFTLQVGRQAMDYRLAIEASSREVLLQRLEGFVDHHASAGVYTAHVKKETHDAMLFEGDEDAQSLLHIWFQKKYLAKIAQVWVKGVNVDWQLLYTVGVGQAQGSVPTAGAGQAQGSGSAQGTMPTAASTLPQRISLPTYPFARERYWIATPEGASLQYQPACSCPSPTESLTATTLSHREKSDSSRHPCPPQGSILEGDRRDTDRDKPRPYIPLWEKIVLPLQSSASGPVPGNSTHLVVSVGGTLDEQSSITHIYPHAYNLEIPTGASIEHIVQRLRKFGVVEVRSAPTPMALHIFWLAPHDRQLVLTQESILATQQQGVLACFRLIKALLQLGYGNQTLDFTVITRQTRMLHASEIADPTHASLLGLCGSLAKEYAHWRIQQVDLPATAPLPLAEILRLPADPHGHGWLYRSGHWYRQTLVPVDVSSLDRREAYRRGGVYVIIGGAGGIGEVWSEYLIRRYQAQIIWIGRRKTDAKILAKQERLATLGPRPHYITADASKRSALQQAYAEIKRNFAQVHGVVHSAVVLLDQSLANIDEEGFQAALTAKIDISVRLAQVFVHEPLDFLLFFSSLNAFAHNAGQSNYAAGSTFEDAFAARLGQDWKCPVKVVNWGYWGSVGVVASQKYQERMARTGLGSIEPAEAMEVLERLLTGPVDQMVFLKTTGPLPFGEIIQGEEMMTGFGPEYLPSYIHHLQNSIPDIKKEPLDPETSHEMQEIEKLLYQFLWSHLQLLGLFREEHVPLADLRKQAGISRSYDRWLQESITHLEHQQYLHYDEHTTYVISDSPPLIGSATLWLHWNQRKERWLQNANLKAWVVLVETVLRVLPTILTGKRSATEILFPNGSMELIAGIYQQNAIADSYNEILARLLVTYLQDRITHEPHARIRILEIGAGTGGTTSKVLQVLQPYQTSIAEYCYSDISKLFLHYGQRRYPANPSPYLTYQLFDVEKPLSEQGIEPGSYDIVIATNVLHATSNIRRTVRNAKAALKMHGLLLLNEITGTNLFFHLTFGLLEGWWAHKDPELRIPGSPALSAENWRSVLSRAGFGAISVAGQAQGSIPTVSLTAGQQVIVAVASVPCFVDDVITQPGVNLLPTTEAAAQVPTEATPIESSTDGWLDKLCESLARLVSRLLKVRIEEIEASTPLSEYGFDSITFIAFAHYLNQTYQLDLTPALFYEHATIERLARYLQATYTTILAPHFDTSARKGREGTSPTSTHFSWEQEADASVEQRCVDDELASSRPLRAPVQNADHSIPASPVTTATPIAIIGMSGTFPQAPDVQSLWSNLLEGCNCISEIPASRWDWQTYFGNPTTSNPNRTKIKWAGVIEDVEIFDPLFFGISKAEAEQMDPQQRLLMTYVWKAIEDAGYAALSLSETNTSLFIGMGNSGYSERVARANMALEGYSSIGLTPSVGPGRMSYFLNLHGPSEPIETACSSSLVAIHRGVNAIESGQCIMAIVGGVNTLISPETHISLSKAGMLSPDGRCKTFGASANGFVRGEGVGMLVLKRLSEAEQAGDHIYGVIRGSAENHGGRASSLTAPNPRAQADLLIAAYLKAGIDPRTVSYIEAHGTGTELGDPIEINGLKTAWSELAQLIGEGPMPQKSCGIGALKSNIGHLELAAGVAGVIKVLLQMQHKTLVKSLHCEQLNSYIQLEASPFYIVQENCTWKTLQDNAGHTLPRRAGVSAFGVGGVNAHVVLEEYVPKGTSDRKGRVEASPTSTLRYVGAPSPSLSLGVDDGFTPSRPLRSPTPPWLILLSARDEERLHEQVQQLLTWMQSGTYTEEVLQDLAYTLQVGREAMEERLAFQVCSLIELEEKLRRYLKEEQEAGDWYRGQVRPHKETIALMNADEDLQETIGKWLQRGKYETLLQWWVKGLKIEWQHLYGEQRLQRISLPTYPFARERYWIAPPTVETYRSWGQLHGLSTRQFSTEEEVRTVLLTPGWKEETITRVHSSEEVPPTAHFLVLLCDLPSIKASHIQAKLSSGGICRNVHSQHSRREQRFQDGVLQLIQELQHLLQSRPAGLTLVQVVVVHKEEPSLLSALAGVLKTAHLEYPELLGQLIEVEGEPGERELITLLHENQQKHQEMHIRYQYGKSWVREWQECVEVSRDLRTASALRPYVSLPWKEGGCYLITGGTGGLSRLFVREIAKQVQKATIILVGRSALTASQRVQLDPKLALGAEGSGLHIDYQQVDVSDRAAVHALIQRVLEKAGHLDGIIHAAGVLRDSLLLNKMPEEVQAVLAPKVMGIEHLDEASRHIPLDFFILCSSLAAVMGNVGQADYAAANAYLDAFAHARQAKVLAGQCHGTTVSINWPPLEEGGMQMEAETAQMMQTRMGIELMGTKTGMRALYQALACEQAQVLVLHGRVERIKEQWLRRSPESPMGGVSEHRSTSSDITKEEQQTGVKRGKPAATVGGEAMKEKTSAYLKKQLAALIKLPAQQIKASAPLSDYGVDSIMAVRITNVLEESFGPLSKTLLFEYPTLDSMSAYFLHGYPEQLRRVLGVEDTDVTALPQATQQTTDAQPHLFQTTPLRLSSHPSHHLALFADGHTQQDKEGASSREQAPSLQAPQGDIAIIGVAGRYPGARDLHTFWENLRTGRDCITEIPPERWDHRLYFDPDKNKPGTTYSKWGGFVDGVDEFDPLFFNISPREAKLMDPQERLFLECAFATLEDAGYTRDSWDKPRSQGHESSRNVGVFVGVMYGEYQLFGVQAQIQGHPIALVNSPSSIANRVSYFCNLHGPSMAVDTMCSSSLTAIHLACQSIRQGECELAIAGGVNVSIHPNKYLTLGQNQFISSQGHCASFGIGADGYVPGEGVGAVLLKPLAQAEEDHDHIYGVIKATAINHGGKTNGYTIPNPQAQANVIGQALKEAGIDPRTISYVETHGTGTVLGDPIEIVGLTRAFQAYGTSPDATNKGAAGWCAIGSVKSNIGHAESAAGIAGITKVLLQMRYGQLVPSLHTRVLNPHIDFSGTPFVVQQELSEWQRPQSGAGEGKRRAGVSSFGAGGSNAHVILEEYVERHQKDKGLKSLEAGPVPAQRSRPALIVLSACTVEQLHERVQQLLAWIQRECADKPLGQAQNHSLAPDSGQPYPSLQDLAYTLQVGREEMEERLALQVGSLQELEEKLRRYIEGRLEGGDWYRGQVQRHDVAHRFATGEDEQKAIAAWISKGKYKKLLKLWVKGGTIDWKLLYTAGEGIAPVLPRRISLPTYPFARERYWLPISTSPMATPTVDVGKGLAPFASPTATTVSHRDRPDGYLHPLVQHNISDFFEQRFSSTFYGEEFFLAAHVVRGQRTMPGVAYLEMARAAIALATRSTARDLHIRDIVWARPLVCDPVHPVTAHIALSLQESGRISFLIRNGAGQAQGTVPTAPVEEETTELVYCQGVAEQRAESTVSYINLAAVQARCQRQISASECYQRCRELGLNYGPAFQGIEQLSVGEGEVLARLRLPTVVTQTRTEADRDHQPHPYVLHPSMLDAALQACIGLLEPQAQQSQTMVPFALDELSIVSEVPPEGWAWVRHRQKSVTGSVCDIDLCDDAGRVVVRLHGLSTRMMTSADAFPTGQNAEASAVISLRSTTQSTPLVGILERSSMDGANNCPLPYIPRWEPVSLLQQASAPGNPTNQVIIVGGTPNEQSTIAHVYPHTHILEIPTSASIKQMAQRLQAFGPVTHLFWLAPHDPLVAPTQESILSAQQQGVLACFRLIKALLQLGYANLKLRWTVITRQTRVLQATETCDPTHASLLGLFGSLAKEASHWSIQQVDIPTDAPLPLAEMLRLPADPQGHGWLYRSGHWYRQTLVPLDVSSFEKREAYRRGGVYVVIGGAGGIGEVWSTYLIHRYQAQIIWIGRRKTDAEILAKRERLAVLGPRPHYIMADATDLNALQRAYQEIKQNFGRIHGVVHSAIILRDQTLANMDEERFQEALAAKVDVSVRLAQVFEHEPLDFVLFFSSLSAFARPAGQSNYTAGCTFNDAFAAKLRQDWPCAVKVMNWGYWGSVGVAASQEYREQMAQNGVGSIEPAEAMEALEQLLAGPVDQMALVKTTKPIASGLISGGEIIQAEEMTTVYPERVPLPERAARTGTSPVPTNEASSVPTNEERPGLAQGTVPATDNRDEMLRETSIAYLKELVGKTLHLPSTKIKATEPLPNYGLNSIHVLQLTNALRTDMEQIDSTVFFEFATIDALVEHFLHTQKEALAHLVSVNTPTHRLAQASPLQLAPVEDRHALGHRRLTQLQAPVSLPMSASMPRRFLTEEQTGGNGNAEEYIGVEGTRAALPIAIIGMSGIFPQARDVQSLWSNLLEGRDCISEIPDSRWDWQTYFGDPATEANKTNIKQAGVIEGIELFDPQFFGISPREAERIDPQQRLLMTYVWKAIEDAGYAALSLSGTNTALFVGTASSGYSERLFQAGVTIEGYTSTSQASMGPNRMSYFLNLHGPSEPIDTACSSSLVAIHRGVNAIESGQCDMAIVGGVNTLISPEVHITTSKAGMLCEDGRCKTFSAQANGYVRGEGVGMLVLKKLVLAEQDGDHIYGVIRGSAENHGGRASSFTAPNPRAQADLLIAAYSKAGIDPRTVGYIEAHGTGTELGDPIEINGIKTTFSELRTGARHCPYDQEEEPTPQAWCGIGSVKSHIGHLELAAGVAGVIKVLLQMQHKTLVKSLHCEQLNPSIQLEGSPFYIVQENQEWKALQDHAGNALPRRAGVSSFGFGGANAHVVLEEYVPKPQASRSASLGQRPAPPLLVLSAKNEERLYEQVQQLLGWVQAGRCVEEDLQDLAYTLQVGREAMEERLALQVSSLVELEEKLRRYLQEPQEVGDWYRGHVRRQDAIGIFSADEDGQKAVVAWMSKGKYGKLLEFWVKGLTIDWKYLYGEHLPRRISLPTYPFARERYWIPTPIVGAGPCACPPPNRVALQSLSDHPVHSSSPKGADQSQPSISLSLSGQSFSQSRSNDVVAPVALRIIGTSPSEERSPGSVQGTGLAQGTIPTAAPGLEEELTRSLAKALYMKQHDIDADTSFIDMGLDSVSSVEWIHTINKQYASNLTASSIYDHPTIRQLASFLEKDLLQPNRKNSN